MTRTDTANTSTRVTDRPADPMGGAGCVGDPLESPTKCAPQGKMSLPRRRLLVRTALAASVGFVARFLPPSARLSLTFDTQTASAQVTYDCYPCGDCGYCAFFGYPAYCCPACNCGMTCYQYWYNNCLDMYQLCGPVDCLANYNCTCNCSWVGGYCDIPPP